MAVHWAVIMASMLPGPLTAAGAQLPGTAARGAGRDRRVPVTGGSPSATQRLPFPFFLPPRSAVHARGSRDRASRGLPSRRLRLRTCQRPQSPRPPWAGTTRGPAGPGACGTLARGRGRARGHTRGRAGAGRRAPHYLCTEKLKGNISQRD